ncbi:beta strand repeat-containing protein [Inquilinus sp. OTU3971]|uniref:beta strand repeat-containing protein n=1 Tax=Inquilinus sp. OTU3971 TaxID=3043855 RepID=UPI00313E2EA2
MPHFILNGQTLGSQSDVAIAATADGGYLGAWSISSALVRGRYVDADGTPGAEHDLNTTLTGNQFDASMTLLGNGHNVVTFTDSSSGTDTVRVRILGDGAPFLDFAVPADAKPLRESDVAALGSGGFAVAYTRDYGAGDTDLLVQRYEVDGDEAGGPIVVDGKFGVATDHASIAGLASGGFVVAWEQSAAAGGDHSVWFQLYNASGVPVTAAGDPPGSHHLIDGAGSINQDIQVAALQDGGFVVAYIDNGWVGADGTEITARVYNADGSARSGFIRVNADIAGDQLDPTVTVLSNGFFVVGWSDNGIFYYQAYDPNGAAVGAKYFVNNGVYEGEILGLAGGVVVNVCESAHSDGDGTSIETSIDALIRTTTGTEGSETLAGDGLRDQMDGGGDNDILDGLGADDYLLGGAGDDVLRGGAGGDVLDGSTGTDTASYFTSAGAVTVDLAAGTGSGGDAAGDTLSGIENLSGSNIGDDVLAGNAGANVLQGWGGGDVLRGGGGADTLEGGAGIDTASYYTSAAGVTVDLATGTASGGDAAGDTLTGIENLSGSNLGNDILAGNGGANTLQGWGGDDVLRGGAGADVLEGGAGIDTASWYTSAAGVTVDLAAGTSSGGDAAGDTLSGIENLSGSNLGGDVLSGNGGANKLQGWGGDDTLRGGAGADALEGGAGIDTASYYTGAAGVTVDLAANTASGGDAAGDTLAGIENLSGSNLGGDMLTGSAGANVLQGWGGNDTLVGGAGKDTLAGGIGADTIVFTALGDSVVGANADVVTDFSHAQDDEIDLSVMDADTGVDGNQAFSFIGANLYSGVAGQLRFSIANGVTTIAGDVDGDAVSDFHITLTGSINLVAADFVL